jgi:hypothetical protein
MDVHLSDEALLYLKGQGLESGRIPSSGLLLGHKRGQRFFVEQVYPSRSSYFSREQNFWNLYRLFGDRIIGFFSFAPQDDKTEGLLQPFAYGKIFLRIAGRTNRLALKAYVIDYKESFFLRPIPGRYPTARKK